MDATNHPQMHLLGFRHSDYIFRKREISWVAGQITKDLDSLFGGGTTHRFF